MSQPAETPSFTLMPVAHVRGARPEAEDDFWGASECRLELTDAVEPSALDGVETFSHVEEIFVFDRVPDDKIVRGARRPRGNPEWPLIGILAQRGKNRPNRLGSTMCRVMRREPGALVVAELDAIEGTPVVDIKPVMRAFLPRGEIREPAWAGELMREYWAKPE